MAIRPTDPNVIGDGFSKSIGDASDATLRLKNNLDEAHQAGTFLAGSLTKAFDGLVIKGKSFSDVLKGVALNLSQVVLKQAFAPLEKGVGSLFEGLFKGIGFAKGGAFQNGAVTPFAQGGVISSPMTFPLSGGATGLAGESGAEAILPLSRGVDGRLGVAASGGSSAPNITINIATQDADSFRRSESQIAAMISRAASMGQRNL